MTTMTSNTNRGEYLTKGTKLHCDYKTFLKLFGKKLDIDYDPPHEPDYDDYKNNEDF